MSAEYSRFSAYNPLGAAVLFPAFERLTESTSRWLQDYSIHGCSMDYNLFRLFPQPRSPESPPNIYLETEDGLIYVSAAKRVREGFVRDSPSIRTGFYESPMRIVHSEDDINPLRDIEDDVAIALRDILRTPDGRMLLYEYWNTVEARGKLLYLHPRTKSA